MSRQSTADEAIGDVIIHQLPASSQAGGREIGTIGHDVPRPLVMDLLGPTGLEQIREGELHEQIAEATTRDEEGALTERDESPTATRQGAGLAAARAAADGTRQATPLGCHE